MGTTRLAGGDSYLAVLLSNGVSYGLEPKLTEPQSVVLTITLTNPYKRKVTDSNPHIVLPISLFSRQLTTPLGPSFCYRYWGRTNTNRTKICCATITPSGNMSR